MFAANDSSALGVLALAGEMGIDVPADLSVIGFDTISESVMSAWQLTTVERPIQLMGQRAVETLLAGEQVDLLITLTTRLVHRQTTAPLKKRRRRS